MAIGPFDDGLLDEAFARPIDAVGYATWLAEQQEDEDILSEADDFDEMKTLEESVRRDVFLILARRYPDQVSVRGFLELLHDEHVRQQFDLIEDEGDRNDCIVAVAGDIADEAVEAVLEERGYLAEMKNDSRRTAGIIQEYSRALLRKCDLLEHEDFDEDVEHLMDADEEFLMLSEAEKQPVNIDVLIASLQELLQEHFEESPYDEGETGVETSDAVHASALIDVYETMRELFGGTITAHGFLDARHDDRVVAAFSMIDEESRDACVLSLFIDIAERAILLNPRFKQAFGEGRHKAMDYALRLVNKYDLE